MLIIVEKEEAFPVECVLPACLFYRNITVTQKCYQAVKCNEIDNNIPWPWVDTPPI